ncbi:hypothetical protein RhiirA4_462606 [Rhizophagus irregularis]|uniref:Uncharacterized protein n=1 Tax=Rhizophagus irregularis TaxID=588596 RepID=A0A2I1GLI8_9GLOM|nr:hypothetical protein RhiirA4_462606 [Rhizophagus irregularis]
MSIPFIDEEELYSDKIFIMNFGSCLLKSIPEEEMIISCRLKDDSSESSVSSASSVICDIPKKKQPTESGNLIPVLQKPLESICNTCFQIPYSRKYQRCPHLVFFILVLILLVTSRAIKAKKAPEFDNFPADRLKLWKVEIPGDHVDPLSNLSLEENEELSAINDI